MDNDFWSGTVKVFFDRLVALGGQPCRDPSQGGAVTSRQFLHLQRRRLQYLQRSSSHLAFCVATECVIHAVEKRDD